ncbi:MAG: arsenate reductase ArsC [Alphaproteobacteria bacterium]
MLEKLPGAVLFACGQNAVRSPMAAAVLRHLAGTRLYVASAGVRSGVLDPFAVAAMEEIGMDISGHTSRSFDDLHDTSFDLIISLAPPAHHRAMELTRTMAIEVEYWPTQDPTLASGNRAQILAAYGQVRDQLFERIKRRFYHRAAPNA